MGLSNNYYLIIIICLHTAKRYQALQPDKILYVELHGIEYSYLT